MRKLRALWIRLRGMGCTGRTDREFTAELESHLQMHVEDNLRSGLPPEEARRQALIRLGGLEQAQQAFREQATLPALEILLHDVRYALRQLRRSPGFTTVALLTLALGIGATTGIFTLVDAVLLKSLPVPRPEQLFLVKQTDHTAENTRVSYPFFLHVRQQLPDTAVIGAMAWPDDFYINAGTEQPERALGQLVSGNYFQVFETWPFLGRLLTPTDDAKMTGSAVAVISYGYWQRRFAGDPGVIGRKVTVNDVPFSIVGVAARGFFGARAGKEPDFWLPLTMQSDVRYHDHYSDIAAEPLKPWIPQDRVFWLQPIVRVKEPAVLAQLTTVMNRVYRNDLLEATQGVSDPDLLRWFQTVTLTLEPGQQGFANLRREFEQPLLLLMGMAVMVLLIACANIANLLLARAAAQQRGFAVRFSMGASRSRLIRQMLTECVLLSSFGGMLGIAVAFGCTSVLPKWASTETTPIPLNLTPDARILIFSVVVTMATGLLFGLAPALKSAHVDPASVLKGSAQSISGREARWSLRKALVAVQVALSLVLLVGAGMFARTLGNYSKLNPGFDRDHLLSLHLDTHMVNYQASDFPSLYQRLTSQLEAIPGVRSASVTTCSIVSGCLDSTAIRIAPDNHYEGSRHGETQMNNVAPNYFETVGIGLLQGRVFATTDGPTSPKVAMVNQAFVRKFLSGGDAVGRRFSYADDADAKDSFAIVGVVADARVNDIREAAPPVVYFPIAQAPGNIDGLEVRTMADPQWIATQVRQAVAAVDHRIPIIDITTLNEEVKNNLTQQRLIARLTSIFGLLALGLACLGLYGVMSYIVERRTSEIGVRLALGSTRSAVLRLVLKETLLLITLGGVIGLALSIAAMHLATSFLFGLSPEDPATIGGALLLLLLVSVAAGFFPAWRAASIDPMQALRTE
jgi:predicted permease